MTDDAPRPGEFPAAAPSSPRDDSRLSADVVAARVAALKRQLRGDAQEADDE